MKPFFATSAWVTVRESLVLRGGRRLNIRLPVRYGLIVHPTMGAVLIDTGYTSHSIQDVGRSSLLRFYDNILRPELHHAQQPVPFLASFGLTPQDVRFVIVSHFHADHISGLTMFPSAHFIANDQAWSRLSKRSIFGNLRHGIFPELIPNDFEDRLIRLSSLPKAAALHGLPQGIDLFGDGSMIAIDLPGHADGHFGILFTTTTTPLLYGVDAEWLRQAVIEARMPGYPARLIAQNVPAAKTTNSLLRRFMASCGELILCHDPKPTAYDFASGDGA
ncbi:MBL fold metallo-hydrolase [Rhizobium sp.]|uniref:MBL fold metallo-hydrolase n=1 Tax=Rhizobium sp. TaxID=391 RepID=UPI000E8EAEB7|nr:MBL fold hydrolase [Rhizobium sp.]